MTKSNLEKIIEDLRLQSALIANKINISAYDKMFLDVLQSKVADSSKKEFNAFDIDALFKDAKKYFELSWENIKDFIIKKS